MLFFCSLFRGRMVSALRHADKAGDLAGIDPVEVSALLDALMAEDWVVYAKPCLEHTESVITYLARYTHRFALSNARILGLDGDSVHLRDRDYRDGEHKTLVLDALERVRRFLLHVLPKCLMRVRHYGVLANRCRVQRLAQIREILTAPPPEPDPKSGEAGEHKRNGHLSRAASTKRRLKPDLVSQRRGRLLRTAESAC